MDRRRFLAASAAGIAAASLVRGAHGEDKPVRVCVIGHTGQGDYGHGLHTMWRKLPETVVVAVADPDDKGRAAALERLAVTRGYADYRVMLAEQKPDIVAVCPRHVHEHHAMIMASIEAGARGIYVEKPVVASLREADAIVAACAKRNVKLSIAHRNRFNPALETVAKFIADGGIGRVLELRGRGKEDQRGGAQDLWVLGTHVLNVAFFFTGPPVAVTGTLLKDGKPATKADLVQGSESVGLIAGNELHARIETQRGINVFFDSIQNAGEKAAGFGLQIIGTKGVIDFRMDETPIAHFRPGSPFKPASEPTAWTPISTAGPGQAEPIANLAALVREHTTAGRDLIDAIRQDRQPLCSAEDGRVLVETIFGAFESHRLGGARTPLPLTDRENPLSRL